MRRPIFFVVAALVPLLLYARTATYGFVHADDADLIAGNQPFLSALGNVPRAFARSYFEVEGDLTAQKTYYRPVAIVSFMLDAARSGDDPRGYHLTNILLHSVATCLLLALALAWGAPAWAAFGGAILFAVHPVNVQAVAWIAGRNDLLLAVFGLLSLIAWTKGALGVGSLGVGGWAWLGVHTAAFALALFSKETGLFFPVLAVLHQSFVQRARPSRAQWVALAADAAVVVAWAVLRANALGQSSELTLRSIQIAVVNLPQVLLHAGKMLAPVRLNVAPGVDAIGAIVGAVAVALFFLLVPKREAIAAAVWALAFLLPTLLVPGLPAYEHRAYVPMIGVLLAVMGRLPPSPSLRRAGKPATMYLVIAVFLAVTVARQPVFHDAFAYWTDAAKDPQFGPIANVNLGQLYEGEGRLADARREYLRALERNPDTPKAHNDLGVVLMKLEEPELALTHFREEARRHPWNADAWYNLGLFEEIRGDSAAARRYYERAIAENRAFLPAYEKLGLTPRRN